MNIKENKWFIGFNICLIFMGGMGYLASYGTHTPFIAWIILEYLIFGLLMNIDAQTDSFCMFLKVTLLWYPAFYSEKLCDWITK